MPAIKNPNEPASMKQKLFVASLVKELETFDENGIPTGMTTAEINALTKGEASELINKLKALKEGGAPSKNGDGQSGSADLNMGTDGVADSATGGGLATRNGKAKGEGKGEGEGDSVSDKPAKKQDAFSRVKQKIEARNLAADEQLIADAVQKVLGDTPEMKRVAARVIFNMREELKEIMGIPQDVHSEVEGLRQDLRDEAQQAQAQREALEKELEKQIEKLKEETKRQAQVTHTFKIKDLPEVKLDGLVHKQAPDLIKDIAVGNPMILVGPTQSGKSKVMEQAAQVLGLDYYYFACSPSDMKADLMGYRDANGNYAATALYLCAKYGGLYGMDEMDNADASLHISTNNGVSNKIWSFPMGKTVPEVADQIKSKGGKDAAKDFMKDVEAGGMVKQHKDFRIVGSANTYGYGGDMIYMGRQPLDGSTLARFDFITWEYDEDLELKLCMQLYPSTNTANYVKLVQAARKAVATLKLPLAITPSHSLRGSKRLAHGVSVQRVLETSLWGSFKGDVQSRIHNEMASQGINVSFEEDN